jgi:hypothetical protein
MPLTLPSRRNQRSLCMPLFASFDCSHEHSPEHFAEVCALIEADAPDHELFVHRWLEPSSPIEEHDSVQSPIFDESSRTCLV